MSDKFKVKEVIFATRADAEDTLFRMKEIAEVYEEVRVADLYDLVGYHSEYIDSQYMWMPNQVNNSEILRVRDGWIISLPTPCPLENIGNFRKSSEPKVTYRNYYYQKPKPTPKTLTIAIDYAGIDSDFDNVLAKAFQYAKTITDREVRIDIC